MKRNLSYLFLAISLATSCADPDDAVVDYPDIHVEAAGFPVGNFLPSTLPGASQACIYRSYVICDILDACQDHVYPPDYDWCRPWLQVACEEGLPGYTMSDALQCEMDLADIPPCWVNLDLEGMPDSCY